MGQALVRWREQLAAWAIPQEILASVPDSPWAMPTHVFARRADRRVAMRTGISYDTAMQALDPPGSVLDVGAGAGAASLPLAAVTTELIAVDTNESMLDALQERANALAVPTRILAGRWPDVADQTPTADVVVCHHVLYNVPDLDTFVLALTAHARRRVVVEISLTHPMRVLNPLWRRLHDLDRPDGPIATDVVEVLADLGITAQRIDAPAPPSPEYASFDELVAVTRQRVCLPPARTDELARALMELGVDPDHPRDIGAEGRQASTLWWDGSAGWV